MHLLYTPQTQPSLSRLIVRTLSAPIYLSNSPGIFGHCAILIWGIETWLGGFLEDQPVTFIGEHMPIPLASSDPPPSPIQASLLCLDPSCLTTFDSIPQLLAPPA